MCPVSTRQAKRPADESEPAQMMPIYRYPLSEGRRPVSQSAAGALLIVHQLLADMQHFKPYIQHLTFTGIHIGKPVIGDMLGLHGAQS